MKVKDIIKTLRNDYQPDDDLIIAYWDKEWFEMCFDTDEYTLTKDDLETIGDMSIDTESVNDEISTFVRELVYDRLDTIEQDEKHLEAEQELEQHEAELWKE